MRRDAVIIAVDYIVFVTETVPRLGRAGQRLPGPSSVEMGVLTLTDSDGHSGHAVGQADLFSASLFDAVVRPLLLGQQASRISPILAELRRGQRGRRLTSLTDRQLCRIDSALWDRQASAAGMPLWQLLGGARERVPAYASTAPADLERGGLSTVEEFAAFAVELVELGYRGIKMHSWGRQIAEPDPMREIALCTAVRDAVGPDVQLMLDGYHWFSRVEALSIGRAIEELGFAWFEEPLDENSVASYRWLSDQLDVPVIGPETLPGAHVARAEWVDAVDILRVGPLNGGGISDCVKTMHLAEAFGMNCEIHGDGAASMALVGSSWTSSWYERGLLHPFEDYEWLPPHRHSHVAPLDIDGFVRMSPEHGLGEHLDHNYIARHEIGRL